MFCVRLARGCVQERRQSSTSKVGSREYMPVPTVCAWRAAPPSKLLAGIKAELSATNLRVVRRRLERERYCQRTEGPSGSFAGVELEADSAPHRGVDGLCDRGDVRRGIGILNNEPCFGRVVWNRVCWARSAADSSKRSLPRSEPSSSAGTECATCGVEGQRWTSVRGGLAGGHRRARSIRGRTQAAL